MFGETEQEFISSPKVFYLHIRNTNRTGDSCKIRPFVLNKIFI